MNMEKLTDPIFKLKFDTLYQNTNPFKTSAYQLTLIFCTRRLLLALATVLKGEYLIVGLYTYVFLSMLTLSFFIRNKPMKYESFNNVEIMNETLILSTSYFMFVFSDWIPDVEIRYNVGFYLMYLVAAMSVINFIIIIREMCKGIKKESGRGNYEKHMKKLNENYNVLIKKVLTDV
jgi:hypothetical protein